MKRLDRYLYREMLVPFLIGTIAVVLMFQANTLIALMKAFSLQNVPPLAIAQFILYKTPSFLNMTLPVGMALASSLAISRLARESELTAMRTAGISIARVILPIGWMGLLVAIGNFYLVESVMPGSERASRKLLEQVGIMAVVPEFKSNVVVNLRSYTASFGSVERSGEGLKMRQILLIEQPRGDETWIYQAESGTYRSGKWTLRKPYLRMLRGLDLQVARPTKDVVIDEPISVPDLLQQQLPEEQTAVQLSRMIDTERKLKRDTTNLEVAYHIKFSVPAACLLFALTSPIFSVFFARSGAFVGVLVSLVQVLVYYNVYVIATQIIGRNGWLPPLLSAWLPNLLFAGFAVWGMRKIE